MRHCDSAEQAGRIHRRFADQNCDLTGACPEFMLGDRNKVYTDMAAAKQYLEGEEHCAPKRASTSCVAGRDVDTLTTWQRSAETEEPPLSTRRWCLQI